MTRLLELAERCETAAGPDAQIEQDIHLFLFPNAGCKQCVGLSPAYTRSLDAAMTLVPEGANWSANSADPWMRHNAEGRVSTKMESGLFISRAATPALALCAAALRARANSSPERAKE